MARLAQLLVLCAVAPRAASAAPSQQLGPSADVEERAPGALEELNAVGLADEDACLADDASASRRCALSLRQLRAAGAQSGGPAGTPEEVPFTGELEDEASTAAVEAWRPALGAPGGWGEAAKWASIFAEPGDAGEVNADAAMPGFRDMATMTSGRNMRTLYHQTSKTAAHLILKHGFRPGRSGWCGGGIYFATSPEATYGKAISADSQQGYIIAAKVDVGRVKLLGPKCEWYMTGSMLNAQQFDSIYFNPGDGPEFVVYSNDRILGAWHHH